MCYDGSQVEDSLLLPPRPNRVELYFSLLLPT
jgi:hypothetical protein